MNPKKKSKELKRISRENLNGRYRLSMSVFLTVTLINLFSDLPFTYLLGNVYATKVQTVIYYIAEVLLSIVVGVLQMGLIRFHINLSINSKLLWSIHHILCHLYDCKGAFPCSQKLFQTKR